MSSRHANRSGIVLRRHVTPAGDVILTLLTHSGKLRGVVRGGMRGNLISRLNLFQHLAVQTYTTPKSDLSTLQQIVLEGALPRLAEPARYGYAHLLAELADALYQEGEHTGQAFEVFSSALRGVSHHDDPEWVALVMSFKLLALAGFVLRTNACTRCSAPDPRHQDPQVGHLVCGACTEQPALQPGVLEFLRSAPRSTVRALIETPVTGAPRRDLWRTLERFVGLHVAEVRSWRGLPHESAQTASPVPA